MSSEFDQLHQKTFKWVSKELAVDSRIQPPYLWYISPAEIDRIEEDVLVQVGVPLAPQFRENVYSLFTEKRRIGLTPIMRGRGTTIFPGIILNKEWPGVISHPDRVLLQENINSIIMRSSPLYQLGSDLVTLRANFGHYVFNVRDLLVQYTEQIGTTLTEIYASKMGAQGEYLEDHPYVVDQSGLAFIPDAKEAKAIEDEIRTASPSRILDGLLERRKYNPAKEAKKLLSAYFEEIARSSPLSGNAIRQQAAKLSRVCDDFTESNSPILVKSGDGSWVSTSTKRLIQR